MELAARDSIPSTECLILATDALICYTWNFLSPSCSSRTISRKLEQRKGGGEGEGEGETLPLLFSVGSETSRRRYGFNIDRISYGSGVLVFAPRCTRMDTIIRE